MSGNVERLRNAHDAFSRGDLDDAKKLVANATTFVDHGRNQIATTRNEFKEWMGTHIAMASDIRLVDADYIDSGEWVTARFRAVGTQDGPLNELPPSNQPFSLDVCEVWRFNEAGEAVEGHNYSDGLGLLMQLGHMKG